MQVSLLCLTEKIGQGTKTLITSDENDDGKNGKKSEKIGQSGGASWWRVCYQWGLPHIINLFSQNNYT